MKLQLDGQHVRVRIDEEELVRLLGGDGVVALTRFGDAFTLRASLRLGEIATPDLIGTVDDWQLTMPVHDVREFAARLPTRDGMHYQIPVTGGDALDILFDVDVRDSVRRRRTA
ncbi:hypothetical protein [Dyella sp. 20L07]|uniref:hypothetical protein n=1 Tax=Dyella sp. 20L07 TaxID=3384240 RepID=UPI003D26E72A